MRPPAILAVSAMLVAVLFDMLSAQRQRLPPKLTPVEIRDVISGEVRIAMIRFTHVRTKPFKNGDLRAAMTTVEGGRFERRFFRNDLTILEGVYRAAGYLDVEILKKRFWTDGRGRLHIRITIDSGTLWHLEEVDIRFAATAVDTADIRQRCRIASGQVFSYNDALAEERSLLAYLNSMGYPHARVTNHLELNADHKSASVVYDVDSGRRMYFGDVTIKNVDDGTADEMVTQPSLIMGKLTFRSRELYDPEQLRRSRNNLARTNLFRSVTISTPAPAEGDSLLPVILRLQERKFINLEALAFFYNSEPGLSSNIQHSNWLGRGTQIGLDGGLGRPLQGGKLFWTQPNIFQTSADLTLSAGLTDEWGNRRVPADRADSLQVELLAANHSVLADLVAAGELGFGDLITLAPTDFVAASIYDYASIERLWQFDSSLTRRWERGDRGTESYQVSVALAWTESRNRPVSSGFIRLNVPEQGAVESTAGNDGGLFDENSFGNDDLFGDDDPFGDEDPFGEKPIVQDTEGFIDYADGLIPIDFVWRRILTDHARTLNLDIGLHRDTRDNQIAPSRGTFLRLTGLYALQFGGQSTRVLDGRVEARSYLPIGGHVVWANASQIALTGSLREDRALPQTYWQELGGEGSVRGVERNSIQAVGGGRAAFLLRSELRVSVGKIGVVGFWDRGGVWSQAGKAQWSEMIDGYGAGLRYDMGIPFRLDTGWSSDFAERRIYFSIGQAF